MVSNEKINCVIWLSRPHCSTFEVLEYEGLGSALTTCKEDDEVVIIMFMMKMLMLMLIMTGVMMMAIMVMMTLVMKITMMYKLIHLAGMIDNSSPMPNIATPTNDNCARPSRTWPPAPTIYLAEYDAFRLCHYQDYQIRKLSDHQIINGSHLISLGSWPRSTVTRKAAGTDALLVTKVIITL